jgi:hypothetical protein
MRISVVPAKAGIQEYYHPQVFWIPAYAGMTVVYGLNEVALRLKCNVFIRFRPSVRNNTHAAGESQSFTQI